MGNNKIVAGIVVLVVIAACIAVIPLSANLGLLFLYIEPNPRHLPPALLGEAIGWSIIGFLSGLIIVVITESFFWESHQTFWLKYRGLVIASIMAMITGIALGVFFAIVQIDSVDGQAMTSRQLAALAGGTAGGVSTVTGIIAGAVLRRFVVTLYRLPNSHQPSRITFNDEDASDVARTASGRSSHAR